MPKGVKMFKMPAALHERAVALDERVVAEFGRPAHHKPGGPGAAVHAGIALLEAVLNDEQRIVPAAHVEQYEAACAALGLERTMAALLSNMALTIALGWALDQGADNPEAQASAIVAKTIRAFVQLEILEPEAEAEPLAAEALRSIARRFLDDADRLTARAHAAIGKEIAQ